MSIASNFENILSAFNKNKVEYMIAGGYAVNFHGYNRSTSDLDIWVKPVELNKEKICKSFLKLKFPPDGVKQIENLDFLQPFSFIVGNEPMDIDIFNTITGVFYSDAEKNTIKFNYSKTLTVKYISLKDLIVNKMLTNRLKDKLDVDELQKIEKLRMK
ncbi:MAG: hypothetical protein ACT4ON_11360 [Bacteroidota bacterium]